METARPTLAAFYGQCQCSVESGGERGDAYLDVVELTSKGDLDHGNDSLLEQDTELTSSVDLGSETAGSEVVLGTKSGDTLLSHTAHHGVASKLQVEVDTSLELSRESSPVRTLNTTGRHELSAGDPVLALVLSSIADHGLGTHLGSRSLVDSLETEGKSRSDALKVATNEDTSKGTIEDRRVHSLDLSSKVVANVVVLKGELGTSRTGHGGSLDLSSGLCDPTRSPSVVEASGEGKVAVKVTLAENLGVLAFGGSKGWQKTYVPCWYRRGQGKRKEVFAESPGRKRARPGTAAKR